ncbi:ADP-ribosylation factor-like protein 6-interacting protein 4 [Amblyraja radiata]|uniref:ADP-ribosylation factor-like protein 6-interacting protein 4 n=1 Tax=Amblyraja radiata TaxID=386614 RepID=UPI001403B152|nr:ADP-ribosylation factor-like protein 6-interacting protein 4 [Amblyraja radiata]XP_032899801.1 ADP-ribosylation factor-like protein 6-interacting protein 4 [Amblyraja radiata]
MGRSESPVDAPADGSRQGRAAGSRESPARDRGHGVKRRHSTSAEDGCRHKKRSRSSKRKKEKEKERRRKKKSKKEKKRRKVESEGGSEAATETPLSEVVAGPPEELRERPEESGTDEQRARIQAMRPMTKEEWDARQSIIRRVVDPETGRERLIKGDGEILEEIVTKDRNKEINKHKTMGDGFTFQVRMGLHKGDRR